MLHDELRQPRVYLLVIASIAVYGSPFGKTRLFLGRVATDDETTVVPIAEDCPASGDRPDRGPAHPGRRLTVSGPAPGPLSRQARGWPDGRVSGALAPRLEAARKNNE